MIRLKIKEVAREKGISQAKLSRLADVDVRVIQKVFRNPYSHISLATLEKIARALGSDPRDLIEVVPDEGAGE